MEMTQTATVAEAEVDEAGLIEDAIRTIIRLGSPLASFDLRADDPPVGVPMWATPLTLTSRVTGREFMLEVKAIECTDWRAA